MKQIAVILPAAGQSSRFGGMEKKPFVHLAGRPVWQRTAELFWNRANVSKVYLVISPEDRDDFRSRFGHVIAFANAELVSGGAERFESVANALAVIPADIEYVAIHDAVRPMTTASQIDAVFHAAQQSGAAMLALPVADTLKRVDAQQKVVETVSRAGLWQAQTPQVFRRDWLEEAYARRSSISGPITDDAQLIEACGHSVSVVNGSLSNFKITTKEDLVLAESMVKSRESGKSAPAARPSFHDEAQW
ncbi:MAG: 2-C-methyl-D-erythritol 4-phosphate cytidylyltransferase [Gemmataceae bacterium]